MRSKIGLERRIMTKEEYRKQLVRMWDSLRDEHRGEENCVGVICSDCPLYNNKACGLFYAFEALELVENWSKEHPVKTNAEKFREVFGFEPLTTTCPCVISDIQCEDCEYFNYDDGLCYGTSFWNAEYKQTK